ncbi:helix-turn-helix domain-containing protein [Phenylobacterium sp.]|uniref:helix-turn-helix domain-containing protein n=1 Tax=Phenylobacterium sp. TaxID=1871053 RepID=UPI0025DD360B|nr:helix-turn-helix domain-containing protein [Phenylobacterium sp.]
MDHDGALTRIRGGRKSVVKPAKPRPMPEADVISAAEVDPDNPPLTPQSLAAMTPVARVRTLRRALGLTQEVFALRYHIPLGTLRDWEQGRSQPDQPARAYLAVIARDPEHVWKALESVEEKNRSACHQLNLR